ncbi:MAG: NFACT family protein, partial [Caldilineaceae bacterium]|nr:NFACT family protein [Caldilineaceae bacterium]
MHFDALTLACITAELRAATCPGRIQQVLLVDEHSLGLEIYSHGTRHQLLLSAQPAAQRIHTVDYKLRLGVARETPLLLLLRKYARD